MYVYEYVTLLLATYCLQMPSKLFIGIIVHGTHSSTVEDNVLYNVRGAGIYIEDGNEMYNDIKVSVPVC